MALGGYENSGYENSRRASRNELLHVLLVVGIQWYYVYMYAVVDRSAFLEASNRIREFAMDSSRPAAAELFMRPPPYRHFRL